MRRSNNNRNNDWNRTDEHFDMGDSSRGFERNERDWNRSNMNDSSYGANDYRRNQDRNFDDRNFGGRGQLQEDMGRSRSSRTDGSFSGRDYQSQSMGQERSGHFGKGPKGWKRADDRIKEEVCEALYRDSEIDASSIDVTVTDGCVYLKGTVDSRQTKRLAEECAENLMGVDDVRNELTVSRDSGTLNGGINRRNDSTTSERSLS